MRAEPVRNRHLIKPAFLLEVKVFLYEHVDAKCSGAEVKHDALLFKPESMSSSAHH